MTPRSPLVLVSHVDGAPIERIEPALDPQRRRELEALGYVD